MNSTKISKQIVGNTGLYYVCYELSKRGWNCLITSRNARGVDIIIYSQDTKRTHTVQVKSLRKKVPVPLGKNPILLAEFLIIVTNVLGENPEIYIMRSEEALKKLHKGEKNGQVSYWLQPKQYEEFKDNWTLIGSGV